MKFYIINDMDRPCPRHVMQEHPSRPDLAGYIHPDLVGSYPLFDLTDRATELRDFGFAIDLTRNGTAHFHLVFPSIAKYPGDGTTRQWQGDSVFSLALRWPLGDDGQADLVKWGRMPRDETED